MNKFILTFTLSAILFVMASFCQYKPDESLLVGSWTVEKFVKGGNSIDVTPLNISLQCSVEGDLGQLSGRTRKDFFSGIYEVKSRKSIKFSNIIRTNYDTDDAAKEFLDSFQLVSKFRVAEDDLLLLNDEQSIYITLRKK